MKEPGPPPIVIPEGILLIYNGADDKLVYSTGWVLFDKNDPTKVLARSEKPAFSPEKEWEKVAGCYEEILFDQPLEQASTLVANALNVRLAKLPPQAAKELARPGWWSWGGWVGGCMAPRILLMMVSVLISAIKRNGPWRLSHLTSMANVLRNSSAHGM